MFVIAAALVILFVAALLFLVLVDPIGRTHGNRKSKKDGWS